MTSCPSLRPSRLQLAVLEFDERSTMATVTMEKAPGATTGVRPAVQAASLVDLNAVYPEVGLSIAGVRAEIDDAYEDIKTFHTREPDEVFRLVSGHSGR